jgi:hypothetical protein
MDPTLEFIGKAAGIFDVCIIIPLCIMWLGIWVQWLVMHKYKLPATHWVFAAISFPIAWLAVHVALWAAEWIWNL